MDSDKFTTKGKQLTNYYSVDYADGKPTVNRVAPKDTPKEVSFLNSAEAIRGMYNPQMPNPFYQHTYELPKDMQKVLADYFGQKDVPTPDKKVFVDKLAKEAVSAHQYASTNEVMGVHFYLNPKTQNYCCDVIASSVDQQGRLGLAPHNAHEVFGMKLEQGVYNTPEYKKSLANVINKEMGVTPEQPKTVEKIVPVVSTKTIEKHIPMKQEPSREDKAMRAENAALKAELQSLREEHSKLTSGLGNAAEQSFDLFQHIKTGNPAGDQMMKILRGILILTGKGAALGITPDINGVMPGNGDSHGIPNTGKIFGDKKENVKPSIDMAKVAENVKKQASISSKLHAVKTAHVQSSSPGIDI